MTAEPHPQRCPPQENGNRVYCIFEKQLYCLMRGWTHTSFSDPKNIISTIIEDNPLCASHSSVHQQSEQEIRKDERDKVLELLDDLRRYANGEYKEADLSDNEHEMRIHLEYENRIWGIMQELRSKQGGD